MQENRSAGVWIYHSSIHWRAAPRRVRISLAAWTQVAGNPVNKRMRGGVRGEMVVGEEVPNVLLTTDAGHDSITAGYMVSYRILRLIVVKQDIRRRAALAVRHGRPPWHDGRRHHGRRRRRDRLTPVPLWRFCFY